MTITPQNTGMSLQVVLLDDDEFMLAVMEELVRDMGAQQVHRFNDARSALQEIMYWQQALLLCDLRMPDMDGIEFMEQLSRIRYPGRIVLCSGGDPRVIRAAEHLGRAHGLKILGACNKPVQRDALQKLLLAGK